MLSRKLEAREEPIRVGLVGAGVFGSQVVCAVESAPGMRTAAIADVEASRATRTFQRAGVAEGDVERCASSVEAGEAFDAGRRAVLTDGEE